MLESDYERNKHIFRGIKGVVKMKRKIIKRTVNVTDEDGTEYYCPYCGIFLGNTNSDKQKLNQCPFCKGEILNETK